MKLPQLCYSRLNRAYIRRQIVKQTEITRDHLTPELKLRLVTPNSPLWTAKPEESPFIDPFWAFYWPGGQALTRYTLDHADDFQGSYVLDIGSGCGATAIAAAKCNAKASFANDIDLVSCEAASMNAQINNCKVHIIQKNMIFESALFDFDYILVGDMFYDPDFAKRLFTWLELCKSKGATVFIGDPGRYALAQNYKSLKLIQEYPLLPEHADQNNGFKNTSVWML